MSHETFTRWWRRTKSQHTEGHLTVGEAAAEIEPLRAESRPEMSATRQY